MKTFFFLTKKNHSNKWKAGITFRTWEMETANFMYMKVRVLDLNVFWGRLRRLLSKRSFQNSISALLLDDFHPTFVDLVILLSFRIRVESGGGGVFCLA